MSNNWDDPNYNRFVAQLEDADYEVVSYEGRGYYNGPAVKCADARELSEVLVATSVPCRWDSLGKGFVVYPR
jgi:hypothetical protein